MAASTAAQCLGPLVRFLPHAHFTKVQEEVIPAVFTNSRNCLVAAPTGSGKTVLLEVAMLRLFRARLEESGVPAAGDAAVSCRTQKAVYICPIKALAHEKYTHWRAQFPSLTVAIETGDQRQEAQLERAPTPPPVQDGDGDGTGNAERMASVAAADILITTPERWDSITRRWKEKEVMEIVNAVGLLMLDEVHTVQEERGAAMEAIVCRVKAIQASSLPAAAAATPSGGGSPTTAAATRIVAVSGTLPNCRDLAEWLQVPPDMTFTFSPHDRPVPLTVRVIGYPHDASNPFAFHRFLSFKLFALMQQYSEGRPTLVFCASRKETMSTAQRLVDDIREAAARQGQTAQLQPSAEAQRLARQAADRPLRSCLLVGVGFHHAAMTRADRELVERMFREQYIAVICATTTLALGVNLPAHLVVIKGTAQFAKGQCQDMPVSEVMQMCGRAGRPGFDTHGVALVLTTQRSARLYDTVRDGAAALSCVESHLHRHMIEHVNAEVALRTIHSFAAAMAWLRTTFFWIRLRKCPRHYGLEFANHADEAAFNADAFAEALMERVLRVLVEEGCVSLHGVALDAGSARGPSVVDEISHPSAVFEATRLGRAMSRLYILFDSVCVLNAKLRERSRPPALCTGDGDGDAPDEDGRREVEDDADEKLNTSTECAAVRATEDLRGDDKGAAGGTLGRMDKTRCLSPFTLRDALQLLCHCQELVEVNLRQGDRGPLNELNKAIRYPLHSGRRGGREVREDWQKAYVLVQAHIGLLPLTEVSLRNDSLRLWAVVPRVARFLVEYAWAATSSYTLALHAQVLARAVERRVWPDGLVLRQLRHVSDAVAKALLRSGLQTFDSLAAVDARQLEVLCSRLPPFGAQVLDEVRRLPRARVALTLPGGAPSRGCGTVELSVGGVPETDADQRSGAAGVRSGADWAVSRFLLVVGIPAEDTVLLKRVVPLSAFTASASGVLVFDFSVPSAAPSGGAHGRRVEARCLVERFLGLDAVAVAAEAPSIDPPHPAEGKPRASEPSRPEAALTQRADVSTVVAAEARRTFGELMADFTYVQGTAKAEEENSAPVRKSRKRTRSCVRVPDAPPSATHHDVDAEEGNARVPEWRGTPVAECEEGAAALSSSPDGTPPAAAAECAESPTTSAAAQVATARSPLSPQLSLAMAATDAVVSSVCSSPPYQPPPVGPAGGARMPVTAASGTAVPARRHRTMVRLQPCASPPAARPLDTVSDAAVGQTAADPATAASSAPPTSISFRTAPPPPPATRTHASSMPFTAAPRMSVPEELRGPSGEGVAPYAMPMPPDGPYSLPWQEPPRSRFTVRVAPNAHAVPYPPTPPAHAYARPDVPLYYQRPPGPPHGHPPPHGEAWWSDPPPDAGWRYPPTGAPAQQAPWTDARAMYGTGLPYAPVSPGYPVARQPFPCDAAMRTGTPQPRYPAYSPYPPREGAWAQPMWQLPPQDSHYFALEQRQQPHPQRGDLCAPPGPQRSVAREFSVPVSRGSPFHATTRQSQAPAPQPSDSRVFPVEWRTPAGGRPRGADTHDYPPSRSPLPLAGQSSASSYDGFAPHARRSAMVPQSWWQ